MSEKRDTAIKLFGKTIPLQPIGCGEVGNGDDEKSQDLPKRETTATPKSNDKAAHEPPDPQDKNEPSSTDQDGGSSSTTTTKNSTSLPPVEEQPNDASNSKEIKTAKKPDKILPCPRCKSLDTKFCYFNNYNVNQPRHFCKRCQRYWTAGGTMRNVPVGAGRRKNKKNSSHCRHITISESSSLRALRPDAHQPVHHTSLRQPNGTVLGFSSDVPLCNKNGFHLEMAPLPSTTNTGNEQSSWPSPFCASSSFPVPFYPAAPYWGCTVAPGTWSFPWLSLISSSSNGCRPEAGSSSPTLGKHSRDGNMLKGCSAEKEDVLAPRTLRIDDPEEAAKSSIWTTVGIKSDKSSNTFKAFQPMTDIKNHVLEAPSLLQYANPAALFRSLNFQETS